MKRFNGSRVFSNSGIEGDKESKVPVSKAHEAFAKIKAKENETGKSYDQIWREENRGWDPEQVAQMSFEEVTEILEGNNPYSICIQYVTQLLSLTEEQVFKLGVMTTKEYRNSKDKKKRKAILKKWQKVPQQDLQSALNNADTRLSFRTLTLFQKNLPKWAKYADSNGPKADVPLFT